MECISQKIITLFIKEKMINEEESEYYAYALTLLVQKIITVGSMLILGIVFHEFLGIGIFLLFFLCLRKRTGGYHTRHFGSCYILSNSICIFAIYFIRLFGKYPIVIYCLFMISFVVIFLIGTVNHPNLAMEKEELLESKKKARKIVMIESGIIMLSFLLDINKSFIFYMSLAIIVCAASLCYARYLKQEVPSYETI